MEAIQFSRSTVAAFGKFMGDNLVEITVQSPYGACYAKIMSDDTAPSVMTIYCGDFVVKTGDRCFEIYSQDEFLADYEPDDGRMLSCPGLIPG